MTYGMFINDRKCSFTPLILSRVKAYETRNHDMLRELVGHRCAIIRTGYGKPMVVGYADVTGSFTSDNEIDRRAAMIYGTCYDCKPHTKKHFYRLENAEACKPYPLPDDAIRHGRSWAEWEARAEW